MKHRSVANVIVLVASLASCSAGSDKKHLDEVRIADRGFLTNAPIYIAEAEGFFDDEGIRLVYTEPPRSTSQIIPLLERGDIDVVTASVSTGFYAAIEKGARIRFVADRGHIASSGCDYNGIMARKDLFVNAPPTPATMRGKRMSLGQSGTYGYVADNYLGTLGLTVKDLDIVRLPETVEPQALDAKTIDLLHVTEPYLTQLREKGHKLIAPSTIYSPGTHYATLEYGPTLTVKRRDVGYRFMKAFLRGVKQFQEGATPRNVAIIGRRTKLDPAVLRKICLPAIYSDGHFDTEKLLKFQQWAVAAGWLDRVAGANAGIDAEFAERAAKELGISSNE